MSQTSEILSSWFARHDKEFEKDVKQGYVRCQNQSFKCCKVTLTKAEIAGGDLYLYAALQDTKGYKSVLGYFVKTTNGRTTARCRHFYRSRSVSAWRAGTGIRSSGAWVKSAEGHDSHMRTGYIMEALLPRELELELDRFHQANLSDSSPNTGDAETTRLQHCILTYEQSHPLRAYFVNREKTDATGQVTAHAKQVSGIVKEYAEEREYLFVMHNGDVSRKVEMLRACNTTTTQLAFQHRNMAVVREKDNLAYMIKDMLISQDNANPNLKNLAQLIQNRVNAEDEYYNPKGIHHGILGMKYSYDTYFFESSNDQARVHVEIAYTETPINLIYKGDDGVERHANTPICWVRNAYIKSCDRMKSHKPLLTSFGSYKYIPIDMAAMVQKPCDYVHQTSKQLTDTEFVTTAIFNKERVKAWVVGGPKHYVKHDDYVGLAVFNESTSYLIKLFKKAKGFQLFQGKYKVFKPENDPVMIHGLAVAAINAYILFQGAENKANKLAMFQKQKINGSHGSEGLERANKFLNHLSTSEYNKNKTVNDLYTLFAKGKIGEESVTGYFGNKIQANPYSLFTYVANVIIGFYYDYSPSSNTNKTVLAGRYNASLNNSAYSKGPAQCIQRMLNVFVVAHPDGVMNPDDTVEKWVRRSGPALLKAFEGR